MMSIVSVVRRTLSLVPHPIALGGRAWRALGVIDFFGSPFVPGHFASRAGTIRVDPRHEPERYLSYAFENILRAYEQSPLGEYIAEMPWKGRTFVDVGANLGIYSMIARACGARCFAVEPEPRHAAFLQRNADLVGDVLPMAFSDKEEVRPIYTAKHNTGATSLIEAGGFTRSDDVATLTFSQACARHLLGNPGDIALIKIDVEGFETPLVAGMSGFLGEGHRPDIWCEVRGDKSGRARGSFRSVIKMLGDYGYQGFDGRNRVDAENPLIMAKLADRQVFDLLFTAAERQHV